MTISEKFKTVDKKIKQNKAKYNLDRQTAKIFALASGSVKYEFLTGKEDLPEKHLLEKSATIKRFEYSPLEKELKAQTAIVKDQYKLFKDQMNVNNNNREEDMSDEDKSGECETSKKFDAISKDIKNIGRNTKPVSVKTHGSNISLHSLIIKLPSTGKTVLLLK